MSKEQKLDKQIRELKQRIDSLRPLSRSELLELKKWYLVTCTYHSNALEGNTLTLAETKVIVEDGLTVGGHPVKEILEAKNHKEVLEELFSIVQKKEDINEKLILRLHKILIKGIDDENAGKYRQIQVYITGEEEKPPLAKQVPELMKKLIQWYKKEKETMFVPELAARFHYRFVKIHPFVDGNGRIARFLANLILMRAGYPLVIIPIVKRLDYINSLKSSSSEDKFVVFFKEIVVENMKDYLRMIKA